MCSAASRRVGPDRQNFVGELRRNGGDLAVHVLIGRAVTVQVAEGVFGAEHHILGEGEVDAAADVVAVQVEVVAVFVEAGETVAARNVEQGAVNGITGARLDVDEGFIGVVGEAALPHVTEQADEFRAEHEVVPLVVVADHAAAEGRAVEVVMPKSSDQSLSPAVSADGTKIKPAPVVSRGLGRNGRRVGSLGGCRSQCQRADHAENLEDILHRTLLYLCATVVDERI